MLAAYDHRARRGAELVGGEIAAHLQELIGELAAVRDRTLGDLTVAGLLEVPGTGEKSSALPPEGPPSTIPASRTVGQ